MSTKQETTNDQIHLTANFSLLEFACPCCSVISADWRLVEALQELRDRIKRPIAIYSAFRCDKKNREVNGANNSRHLIGLAADVGVPGMRPIDIFLAAEKCKWFAGFGLGSNYMHLDVRNRGPEFWYYDKGGRPITCTRSKLYDIGDNRDNHREEGSS